MNSSANASLKRRLACLLYESLVVFSILLIGFLLPQVVLSGFGMVFTPRLLWAHILILLMIYFMWCWLNGGQTLPMKTWKIQLVGRDGKRIRPTQALLRYLAAWPSTLLLIGLLWALFDKEHLFLHDRIAGTRLISLKD